MRQQNINDYHSWNITKNGNIIDNLDMDYLKYIANTRFNHEDYDIVYKEWDLYSQYYDKKIDENILLFKVLSKQEQVIFLKKNYSNMCDRYSTLRKILFNYTIKFGSLGLKDNKTSKIFWEFGNGKNTSDF